MLSIFHGTHGMQNTEDNRITYSDVMNELSEKKVKQYPSRTFDHLEQAQEGRLQDLINDVKKINEETEGNRALFKEIVSCLTWAESLTPGYNEESINKLEENRNNVSYELIQGICVEKQLQKKRNVFQHLHAELHNIALQKDTQKNKDMFKLVLQEIKKDEAVQGCELPEGLTQFLDKEASMVQEEQNIAFLSQSLVGAENVLQSDKVAQPITVGLKTRLYDWWFGPSNLENDFTDNKLSLDMLKNSPELQDRINNIIAKSSPKNRNVAMLTPLKNIYTALKNMNFMSVNGDINSDIHNSSEKWRTEEENAYILNKKARILTIVQFIHLQMEDLNREEKSRLDMIATLEEIEALAKQTGIVQQIKEEIIEIDHKSIEINIRQEKIETLEVFEIMDGLEKLCEKVLTRNNKQ
jgi:hypothetical protein